jgi:hypothetical protein
MKTTKKSNSQKRAFWNERKRFNKINDLVHRIGYYARNDGRDFPKRFPRLVKAIERMITEKPGIVVIDKKRLEQLEEIERRYFVLTRSVIGTRD